MKKEDLENLLKSLEESDYYKNIDLHIHSNESDGRMNPVDIVKQAKEKGKKYIAITDHNTIEAYLSTNILSEEIVIPAVEFDCFYKGVLIHILGYGIDIDNQNIKVLFAKSKRGRKCKIYRALHLRNPQEVIEKIHQAGGIAVLAHPACYWCINLDKFIQDLKNINLDGLEVYYPYKGLRGIVKFHSKNKVLEIADKYNMIKTGGSDTHSKKLL